MRGGEDRLASFRCFSGEEWEHTCWCTSLFDVMTPDFCDSGLQVLQILVQSLRSCGYHACLSRLRSRPLQGQVVDVGTRSFRECATCNDSLRCENHLAEAVTCAFPWSLYIARRIHTNLKSRSVVNACHHNDVSVIVSKNFARSTNIETARPLLHDRSLGANCLTKSASEGLPFFPPQTNPLSYWASQHEAWTCLTLLRHRVNELTSPVSLEPPSSFGTLTKKRFPHLQLIA